MIKDKLATLPDLPGCYLMKDVDGNIIYVGKAKNLKSRVKSYFTGAHNAKTTKLVSDIRDFDFITVKSELEALILEINLIKKHNPKYNIMLTDDKTYPYIALTNEKDPRLFVTRNPKLRKKAKFYGPYPNVKAARLAVEILNRTYPLRKCQKLPKKECLYYHMNLCYAPCIFKKDFDYTEIKRKVNDFLNGNDKEILDDLKRKMNEASLNTDYELAIEYRNMISELDAIRERQIIEINDYKSKDFIGFYADDEMIAVHILMMRTGSIVQNYQTIFSYIGDKMDAQMNFLMQYYSESEMIPKEIIIDAKMDSEILSKALECECYIPLKGKKKEILDLAIGNAKKDLENSRNIYKSTVLRKIETVESLGALLEISAPYYIEAFDNSNLFGEYPVSAMVVFKNGKPVSSEFRKYHVKTVDNANDYATMKEIVYRRYYRLLMEDKPMPDLLIMDGGDIQVNAAKDIIKSLNIKMNIMGIQKDSHHKASEIVFEGKHIKISKNSDIFLLISNISQTAHDFAIRFFRSKKTKGLFESRLDGIKGLGPVKREKLLKKFVTIEAIKNANIEEFADLGIKDDLANEIKKHLA